MGERKVLNKYYPPDFDPAKIPRRKNDKNKQIKVRMMLPMSIRCSTCGTYIYKGTKFNSRKEDVVGETYLGIQIFRFYFKCTKCSAEITMKTDPQNSDYVVESGAARNFEPWRAEDEVADSERKQRDAEEMGDAMKTLENKAMDSKQDMDILAALEEMKSMKTRHETVSPEVLLEILTLARNEKEKQVEEVEKADEEIIKSIVFHNSKDFVRRIQDDDDDDEDIEDGQASSNLDEKEDHNFKRKRTLGNPTDSLTPISIFNNSKTGDTGAVAPKPKFVLKPRIATNGAKRPCVRPSESDKPKVEANTKGSGTNVLQSICANYDSDDMLELGIMPLLIRDDKDQNFKFTKLDADRY